MRGWGGDVQWGQGVRGGGGVLIGDRSRAS